MTLDPGFLLHNRYRVSEVITRGGMGAIYRAYDENLNITVAIKENFYTTEEYSRQFKREATMLASLRHPNLPRVTDHFVLSGQGQYLVMDFIEGEDLKVHLDRSGVLREDDLIIVGLAICDALSYLHTRDPAIVHRDVKPGNIKITPSGQIFLVDFGLAKRVDGGQMTTIGAQALTPGFAPPEQYGGGTEPSSDIFSLGATLYVACTNTIPVDSLERALGGPQLIPIRKINPKINEKLAATIEKAMAVDPRDRFLKDLEFRKALLSSRRFGRGQNEKKSDLFAGSAHLLDAPRRHSTETSNTNALPSKASTAIWVMGTLAGFLILGTLYRFVALPFLSENMVSTTNSTNLNQSTYALSDLLKPTNNTQSTSGTPSEEIPVPTTKPIGGGNGQIAFASARNGNMPQIYLVNADGTKLQQITQQVDGACQPAWAPDGKRFLFVSPCSKLMNEYRGSSLFVMNADGSGLLPISSTPDGDYDPVWSPDGTKIAFTSLRENRPHIYVYDLSNKTSTLLSPSPAYDSHPTWSPDGKTIAFQGTRSGLTRIWSVGVDGKNSKPITREEYGGAYTPAWSPDGEVILYTMNFNAPKLYGQRIADNTYIFEVGANEFPIFRVNYSPDGMFLVLEGKQDGTDRDIFLMTRNGTNLYRLTNDPADDFSPVWRPLTK